MLQGQVVATCAVRARLMQFIVAQHGRALRALAWGTSSSSEAERHGGHARNAATQVASLPKVMTGRARTACEISNTHVALTSNLSAQACFYMTRVQHCVDA